MRNPSPSYLLLMSEAVADIKRTVSTTRTLIEATREAMAAADRVMAGERASAAPRAARASIDR